MILLYFALSPYQQCVRRFVNMSMNKQNYDRSTPKDRPQSELARIKAGFKARGQVLCARRMS